MVDIVICRDSLLVDIMSRRYFLLFDISTVDISTCLNFDCRRFSRLPNILHLLNAFCISLILFLIYNTYLSFADFYIFLNTYSYFLMGIIYTYIAI